MKRIYVILLAALAVTGAMAQPDVEFSEMEHSLGTLVWHNPAGATFRIRNTGAAPLTITDVVPDCGCTMVEWTTAPIEPDKEGSISVHYDAEMLGHFSKGLAVYLDQAETPVYLTVSGKVVDEAVRTDVDYAFEMGGLALNTDQLEFDDVRRGDEPFRTIEVFNRGQQPVRPNLLHLPRYLTASYAPEVLYPGRGGKILVTLRSELLPAMGLTQAGVYLSTYEGERINPSHEISVSATLLPEVAEGAATLAAAPVASLDRTSLDLGSLRGRSKVKGQILLTNTGRTPLTVRALQVYNPGISVSIGSKAVKPGQTVKMKITATPAALKFRGRRRILLITDDPQQPKAVIDVEVRK